MNTAVKGKRGPKKGWLDKLHADLRDYKDEADFLRGRYMTVVSQRTQLANRISNFNSMGFWAKVLFLTKGGQV